MPNTWGDLSDWGSRRIAVYIVGCGAVVTAILSVIIGLLSSRLYPWVYGFWIITPPMWFFAEYHFIFKRKDDRLEQFKYMQDLAQKFWAALLVLLAGIGYFKWHLSLSGK